LINPIGSFKNISSLLNDEYEVFSEKDIREFIRMMKDSSSSLLNLLENLLTWSRSQNNKILFEPENTNIYQLTNSIISVVDSQAKNKGIIIENQIEENFFVFIDINMIYTVLHNIITNAIKFSNAGGKIMIKTDNITIDKKDCVEISIIDNGIGMSQSNLEKLFRIDENISTPGTLGEKGTGLGLILVKEFVTKNNGFISVSSELGIGTTFRIALPVE
jgi:signal transduction histidine kinase